MPRFPIFKLPFLALQRVIEVADPADIFHLSLSSTKCRQTVQTVKPQVPKTSWFLHIQSNGILVEARKCPQNQRFQSQFRINIFERKGARPVYNFQRIQDPRAIRLSVGYTDKFNQDVLFLRESDDKIHLEFEVQDSKSREDLLKLLIAYLKSIYTSDHQHIRYWANPKDPKLLDHFLPIRTLSFKYLNEYESQIFYFLGLEKGQIDSFYVEERNFHAFWGRPPVFETPISVRNLDFYDAPWLSFRNISNLDFVNLKVGNPNLTNTEVNRLLHLWSSGGYHQLESFCFRSIETELIRELWDMGQILDGLNIVKKPCEKVRIIQRSDGLKAQIFCHAKLFGFVVLHPWISENKLMRLTVWHTMGYEANFLNCLN